LLLLFTSLTYPGSNEPVSSDAPEINYAASVYEALADSSLNCDAFLLGVSGLQSLVEKKMVDRQHLLTIIDYSRPSDKDRFFVIDLQSQSILYKTLVAHGRNSGDRYAGSFSNRPQSHQSALGFYITGNTYKGGQGYSLLLNGVDTGFNDNARKRAIVIHGADYVTQDYIERYGRLGRSFGCPALPPQLNSSVIDLIKDGSVIFAYYPDDQYLSHSSLIH
jgi:hypothetical protein